jgi:hypothetical protein
MAILLAQNQEYDKICVAKRDLLKNYLLYIVDTGCYL